MPTYTSKMAAVVCKCSWNMGGRVSIQAASLGTLFSIMADECTNVTTIEELTIVVGWRVCTRRTLH